MRKFVFIIFMFLSVIFGYSQYNDPCFTSATSATSFISSANLADVGGNSDLCYWTGTTWTGDWPGANLTIVPPINQVGCRAIWQGNGTTWTTGGEGFGIRLTTPLVTGVTYTFPITYVSHGFGSTGSFTPRVYTNSAPSTAAPAVTLGLMPAVGTSWTTNNLTFTATAAQNGHVWLIFGTWPNLSSGFVNSFCPGCTTIPLPVELTYFDAEHQQGTEVLVKWTTATEVNNSYFILQRSTNAIDFENIVRIEGAGNSNTSLDYQWIDKNGIPGTSYYRLKQVDYNGAETTHEIRTVNISVGHVYPNPASDLIQLPSADQLKIGNNETATISISNNLGQEVLRTGFTESVNISTLHHGHYTLRVYTSLGQVHTFNFIKE